MFFVSGKKVLLLRQNIAERQFVEGAI